MSEEASAGPLWTYRLNPGQSTSPINRLTDSNGYINSTRVMNKFISALGNVPNYQKAEINRDGEAVTFQLASYTWNFDIVPSVEVGDGIGLTTHYLIPNGRAEWKRSDPRKDAAEVTAANQRHNELLLPLIRLIKYWNRRPLCPALRSYYLETICLNIFAFQPALTNLPEGIRTFFQLAPGQIQMPCPDPRGFGPSLDADIDWSTKTKVVNVMQRAATAAQNALQANQQGQIASALGYWKQIFGDNFPAYG